MKEPLDIEEQPLRNGRRRGANPLMWRGADDQAAAYEALLALWADTDPEADEREWQRVKRQLQETRRAMGQRLLFPE